MDITFPDSLTEAQGGRIVLLLCRDQLSASAWRRLQARVRLDLGRPGLS